jgi:hypothetical protein
MHTDFSFSEDCAWFHLVARFFLWWLLSNCSQISFLEAARPEWVPDKVPVDLISAVPRFSFPYPFAFLQLRLWDSISYSSTNGS